MAIEPTEELELRLERMSARLDEMQKKFEAELRGIYREFGRYDARLDTLEGGRQ